MCFYIEIFTFLQSQLQKLPCLSSKRQTSSRKIVFKFLVQITLVFFLTQVLNCAFDEFIFVGMAKIFERLFSHNRKISKLNANEIMPEISVINSTMIYAISIAYIFAGIYINI